MRPRPHVARQPGGASQPARGRDLFPRCGLIRWTGEAEDVWRAHGSCQPRLPPGRLTAAGLVAGARHSLALALKSPTSYPAQTTITPILPTRSGGGGLKGATADHDHAHPRVGGGGPDGAQALPGRDGCAASSPASSDLAQGREGVAGDPQAAFNKPFLFSVNVANSAGRKGALHASQMDDSHLVGVAPHRQPGAIGGANTAFRAEGDTKAMVEQSFSPA